MLQRFDFAIASSSSPLWKGCGNTEVSGAIFFARDSSSRQLFSHKKPAAN